MIFFPLPFLHAGNLPHGVLVYHKIKNLVRNARLCITGVTQGIPACQRMVTIVGLEFPELGVFGFFDPDYSKISEKLINGSGFFFAHFSKKSVNHSFVQENGAGAPRPPPLLTAASGRQSYGRGRRVEGVRRIFLPDWDSSRS